MAQPWIAQSVALAENIDDTQVKLHLAETNGSCTWQMEMLTIMLYSRLPPGT